LTKIVLVGGGGHCISCIETIESGGKFQIAGIVDGTLIPGIRVQGYEILGNDEVLSKLVHTVTNALICIGHIASPAIRSRLWDFVSDLGFALPSIVAPTAHVSSRSDIGSGTIVMHAAMVNAMVQIGSNCIVNTGAIVEHGTIIGDHVHVSTGALVNGDCRISDGVFIGSGAVLKQGIRVAEASVVGAGAIVVHDIDEPGVYVGNPAMLIHA